MSYVKDNLMADEQVIHTAHLSNWAYWYYIVFGILLSVVGVGIIILISFWITKISTELAVTNKRVIVKTGFINRKTVEINIKKVESIQVEQGFWGRMFNYGTIIVSGTGSNHAPIKSIHDPIEFRKAVIQAQDFSD